MSSKMISKSFARCLAKISGDGYLYYRYIRYRNKCPELINEFKEDIIKEFGNINLTKGKTNSGTQFIQIHGKRIIGKFLEHLPDFRSNYIFVPDSIKDANLKIKKEFLRAFYDDEGSPSLRIFNKNKQWKRTLTLSSNSKRILEEIKNILFKDFGIKSNQIIVCDKTKGCFVLGISGKENFTKFKRAIEFKHPRKIKKLGLIIQSYGNTFNRNRDGFNKIYNQLRRL